MKRSDAIQKIIDIVYAECYDDLILSKDEADGILSRIEAEGFLPPPYSRKMDWHERGITYAQWCSEPSRIHEWEKE